MLERTTRDSMMCGSHLIVVSLGAVSLLEVALRFEKLHACSLIVRINYTLWAVKTVPVTMQMCGCLRTAE